MSLCSLLLSLETPNDVQSVALQSYNIQATSKGSDQTDQAQADLSICWSHIPHCWKSHVAAHFTYICDFRGGSGPHVPPSGSALECWHMFCAKREIKRRKSAVP